MIITSSRREVNSDCSVARASLGGDIPMIVRTFEGEEEGEVKKKRKKRKEDKHLGQKFSTLQLDNDLGIRLER